ncbi:MAG TPA: hypothetical protein VHX42_01240 [Candidatus Babeliales bacterium]|jgi:hypothetical protein|nr:hypothetical protein [Candidatus Babeliales bacterium]
MSVCYAIYGRFDLKFTKQNVKLVVQKASDIGFIYMAREDFVITSRHLNVDQATDVLLTTTEEILDEGGAFLYGRFQDTGVSIRIREENNALVFSFGSFYYRWDKDFSNGQRIHTIDFARYIRLMLDVCKDITLLDLHTFADNLTDIIGDAENCVVAALDLGFFGEKYPGGHEIIKLSIEYLLSNAVQNKFVFFDEFFDKQREPFMQNLYDTLKADFPINLYAKKDHVPVKIEIKKDQQGNDFVSIYPVEPYLIQKGHESNEEKLDASFYVQRLLELCENFAIYELKTFF